MTRPGEDSPLPRVNDENLGRVTLDEIIDPTHFNRFHRLQTTNPKLASEIVRNAYVGAYLASQSREQNAPAILELQKLIIDQVTYATTAIEEALRRQRTVSGGPCDEDQLHSNEPGDDLPDE